MPASPAPGAGSADAMVLRIGINKFPARMPANAENSFANTAGPPSPLIPTVDNLNRWGLYPRGQFCGCDDWRSRRCRLPASSIIRRTDIPKLCSVIRHPRTTYAGPRNCRDDAAGSHRMRLLYCPRSANCPVEANTGGPIKLRSGRQAAIAAKAHGTVAGNGTDHAGRRQFANPVVTKIRNK